ERPSNRKRVDQVVFFSLFAGEVRLIVPAAAAAIDRLVGIHADLASARNRDRSRLRRDDIVGRYAILDPVHERGEQRFPIDLRSADTGGRGRAYAPTVTVAGIWEKAVELLRLLVVTL